MIRVVEPLEDRVLVKPDKPLEQTKSGLIIPPSAQGTLEKLRHGKVVLKGADAKRVQEGDYVMYGQYTGTEVEHENMPHLMMREADIVCIVGIDTGNEEKSAIMQGMVKDGQIDLRISGNGC